ncbi:MAG: hypothetical protein AB1805_07490 [Nitrospirota bacterium]
MMEQAAFDFDLTGEERMILAALREGKENAILGDEIVKLTGIGYDRVRQVISHLVNEHFYLIASYSRGYYIPTSAEEVSETTRSLRHRGISILVRAAKLQKKSVEEIFNQSKLEFQQ